MPPTHAPPALLASLLLLSLLPASACRGPGAPSRAERVERRAAEPVATAAGRGSLLFEDASERVGLDYRHVNGMTGEMYIVEVMGPGGALVDYDGDGDLDLFLRQGGPLRTEGQGTGAGDRLYRNDPIAGADGGRDLRLIDVSRRSLLRYTSYGMGVAVGDVDNDAWPDLYLTNFGPNRMLRNEGDGTFSEVAVDATLADERWSVPASFGDFDRDGWLDLYVGSYVDFDLADTTPCFRPTSAPDYCGPLSYGPEPDRLFVNRREGGWEDVTIRSGLASSYGNALGSLVVDADEDGWPDLYVANDIMANQLWINRHDGTFRDEAALRGCALSADGVREGSMGVDAADIDGDGDEDLVLTHWATETDTLYVNQGEGMYLDRTAACGLAASSRPFTGFGTALLDWDNDGWPDLLVLNGHVRVIEELEAAGDPFPLHQTNQLYRNRGDGTFEEVTRRAGAAFALSEVSRGAALGDVDNDGDTDFALLNNNGPARLLLNRVGQERHWLGLRLLTGEGPRDALGARVTIRRSGGPALVRRARTDGSYASARDPRILAGLGERQAVEGVRIDWPSGGARELRELPADRYIVVREGGGRAGAGPDV